MPKYIVGPHNPNNIAKQLHEAGMIGDIDFVRRIIFDFTAGSAGKMIVEYYADQSVNDILAQHLIPNDLTNTGDKQA